MSSLALPMMARRMLSHPEVAAWELAIPAGLLCVYFRLEAFAAAGLVVERLEPCLNEEVVGLLSLAITVLPDATRAAYVGPSQALVWELGRQAQEVQGLGRQMPPTLVTGASTFWDREMASAAVGGSRHACT